MAPGGISRHSQGSQSSIPNSSVPTENGNVTTQPFGAVPMQEDNDSADINIPVTDEALNVSRNGRGASRCIWLDKKIKKLGKKIQIVFPKGRKVPKENGGDFTRAIGYIVKTHAVLSGVNYWREIPNKSKVVYVKRLDGWFEIADANTPRVRKIIVDKLSNHYRQWRNTLHMIYKERVAAGEDPREKAPRKEVKIEAWHELCDWFENDKFQTEMRERLARSQQSMEDGEEGMLQEEMLEDEIMIDTLGRRPNYVKGMGYGMEAPHSCYTEVCSQREVELRKQLEKAESDLQDAQSKIESLIQTQEEKLEAAKDQMCQEMREEMNKMLVEYMSRSDNNASFTLP